jgi:hypothetical protein
MAVIEQVWRCTWRPVDSTSRDGPGPGQGSVRSGPTGKLDWTEPQTGSLGLDGLGLDRSIYAYNCVITF